MFCHVSKLIASVRLSPCAFINCKKRTRTSVYRQNWCTCVEASVHFLASKHVQPPAIDTQARQSMPRHAIYVVVMYTLCIYDDGMCIYFISAAVFRAGSDCLCPHRLPPGSQALPPLSSQISPPPSPSSVLDLAHPCSMGWILWGRVAQMALFSTRVLET